MSLIDPALLDAIRLRDGVEQAPGLAVAILKDGRLHHAVAVGSRTLDPAQPLLPTTRVRVASISKLAVAFCALALVEEGRLDLDAPADALLEFSLRHPEHPDAPITLRHLLTHTSGFGDGEVYWGTLGERLADFFTPSGERFEGGRRWLAGRPPGTWHSYCNLASGVVATLIERASGRRFDLLARERLFAPLGLGCGFNWSGVAAEDVAAGGAIFRNRGDGWTPEIDGEGARRVGPALSKPGARLDDYRLGDNGLLFGPQGGLRASVVEVAKFGALLLGRGAAGGVRVLRPETARLMLTPAWTFDAAAPNGEPYGGLLMAQAIGAQILTPEASPIPGQTRPLFGHFAEAYGLVGGLLVDPERGAGFAYLVNGERPPRDKGVRSAAYRIEEHLMGLLAEAAFG